MTQRYYLYDTKVLDPAIDPLKAREVIDLEYLDVLGRFPTDNGVAVFYRNDSGQIVYGKFDLQPDENYTGRVAPISDTIVFEENTTVIIKNSFYKEDSSYYIFYDIKGKIFVRTFLTNTGSVGEPIEVIDKAEMLKLERVKENFIIVYKDLTHLDTYNTIEELDRGEIKLAFLFENDLVNFETSVDSSLKTQIVKNPFTDIGLEKWSCKNKVANEKGFLYFEGDVELVENFYSINGFVFETNKRTFVEMNKETDNYTLTVRGKISNTNKNILETNNLGVKYTNGKFHVTYPNGMTESLSFDVNFSQDSGDDLVNITVVVANYTTFNLFSVYITNSLGEQSIFNKKILHKNIPGYENDAVLIMRMRYIDYLSLQNIVLVKNAILDKHSAFNRNLVGENFERSLVISDEMIRDYDHTKQSEYARSSVYKLPSDVVLVQSNYETTDDDYGKAFWVCGGVAFINTIEDNIVYLEKNSVFLNKGSIRGTVYAKDGASVEVNGGKSFNVFCGFGTVISKTNESVFVQRNERIIFDYNDVSEQGCREEEELPSLRVLDYPFIPDGLEVDEVEAVCLQEPTDTNNSRFGDNNDGTINDNIQGVMWMKTPITIPQTSLNKQNEAYRYVNELDALGYNDWRMPTIQELASLNGIIDVTTTCVSGYDQVIDTVQVTGMSGTTHTVEITSNVVNECKTGVPYVLSEDGVFDFTTYIDNFQNNISCWTTESDTMEQETGDGQFYTYDMFDHSASLQTSVTDKTFPMGLLVRDLDIRMKLKYDDGEEMVMPIVEGEVVSLKKEGKISFGRNSIGGVFDNYSLLLRYKEKTKESKNFKYHKHHKLNSTNNYFFGTYLPVKRVSDNDDLRSTIVPIFITDDKNIPNAIFANPEEQLRVCENLRQRYDLSEFIIEYDNNARGITVWINLDKFRDQIGIQYSLKNEKLLKPTYSSYETLSSNLYPIEEYYCAYHFDKLLNVREILIKDMIIENAGELILGGITDENTYLRELKSINFFDNPKRYKTSYFDVLIDAVDINDRESYINNYEEIRNFIKNIVDKWKPATASINRIIEDKTLIMAELLKDEFTQVLVGLTSRQNTNVYYIRSVDTGNLSLVSSSKQFQDDIDWVGVGRINTAYLKTGVTKVKKPVKKMKVLFETRYQNDKYRTFVFSPNNNKYFTTYKDRDGFIVESSSLVKDEIAWITLNTNQTINGIIKWKRGVAEGELLPNNIDRIDEVNDNSNRYEITFQSLGYADFIDTNYSVIMSVNKNINVWVEDKQPDRFLIRRSYAGEDLEIDFMVVEGNSKWWKNING